MPRHEDKSKQLNEPQSAPVNSCRSRSLTLLQLLIDEPHKPSEMQDKTYFDEHCTPYC